MRNRIAELRRARGWSQTDLAMELRRTFPSGHFTTTTVSLWERGRDPELANALRIARVFGQPVEAVFIPDD